MAGLSTIYYMLANAHNKRLYKTYRQTYAIDDSFQFRGWWNTLHGEGVIILGANSYMSSYCVLESAPNCTIDVGRNTAIGPYVRMYTANRIFEQDLDVPQLSAPLEKKYGDITIGRGCWIGSCVGIAGGVKIGDNSVIGMNSVVTHDIPSNSFAAGCPAVVRKTKTISR